jgi:hypothetical protein
MGPDRIALEHHSDVAPLGRNVNSPVTESTICPAISMLPRSGRSNPATQRSVVVLPQPLGPSRTTNSPSPTSRSILSTAQTCPRLERNTFSRFRMRITVAAVLIQMPRHSACQTARMLQGEARKA